MAFPVSLVISNWIPQLCIISVTLFGFISYDHPPSLHYPLLNCSVMLETQTFCQHMQPSLHKFMCVCTYIKSISPSFSDLSFALEIKFPPQTSQILFNHCRGWSWTPQIHNCTHRLYSNTVTQTMKPISAQKLVSALVHLAIITIIQH